MQYVEKYIYIFFFDKQLIPAAVLPLRFPRRIHDKIEFFFLCPKRIPDALYVIENIPIFNIALPAAVAVFIHDLRRKYFAFTDFRLLFPDTENIEINPIHLLFPSPFQTKLPLKNISHRPPFSLFPSENLLIACSRQRNAPLCYSHYNTSSRTLQGFRKNSPVAARPSAPPALPAMKAQIACLFARGML